MELDENENINNDHCCVCGISFEKAQKCAPILDYKYGVTTHLKLYPMGCAICFTINKIRQDLDLLQIFVKDRNNLS